MSDFLTNAPVWLVALFVGWALAGAYAVALIAVWLWRLGEKREVLDDDPR